MHRTQWKEALLLGISLFVLVSCAELAVGVAAERKPAPVLAKSSAVSLAPIEAAKAVSRHAPYEMGDCKACHARDDAKDPGPARKAAGEACTSCHEELPVLAQRPNRASRSKHPGPRSGCGQCHNPHNSVKKSLLL